MEAIFTLAFWGALISNYASSGVKFYPKVPLCCHESEIYNESTCVSSSDSETLYRNLPVRNEGNFTSFQKMHQPTNCSSYQIFPLRNEGTPFKRLFVSQKGFVSLVLNNNYSQYEDYLSSEFCILRDFSNFYVRLCDPKPQRESTENVFDHDFMDCSNNICVSKCCNDGEHVFIRPKFFGCSSASEDSGAFIPHFKYENGTKVNVTKNVSFIVQFPLCKLYDYANVRLLANGNVFLPTTTEVISRDKYCLDTFEIGGRSQIRGSVCSETLELSFSERVGRLVHPVGLLVSCIFLAVTFICHVIIPKLRDMQGLCFMSYVAALFFGFLFLCVNILLPNQIEDISPGVCVALATLNHFSLMASFFWLNVMCYDIWKIMRGTSHSMHLKDIHSNKKRTFTLYCLYAWGCPLVVSLVALVIHLLPESAVSDRLIRPQFSKVKCWFSNDIKVLFAYYNGVTAVLFFINIVFIIHTSTLLYRAGVAFTCCRKRTFMGGDGTDVKGNNRLMLNMFWHRFCLFALMALNWTTEVLSFIPPSEMWILTDILNSLQGLFIFILFMRSSNKRMMLIETWNKMLANTRKKMASKNPQKKNEEFKMQFLRKGVNEGKMNIVEMEEEEK